MGSDHLSSSPIRRSWARATAGGLATTLALVLALVPASAPARGDDRAWLLGTGGATRATAAAVGSLARAPSTVPSRSGPGSGPAPDYALPVPGAVGDSAAELLAQGLLLRGFVDPGPRWGAGHRGVDLAAAAGSPVVAPGGGTVTFVGVVVDRPLVVVTHRGGLRSTLEPVVSDLTVGSQVSTGEVIGSVAAEASTHCAPTSCLHWGVRVGEEYIDPLLVLGGIEAVVLLPMG